MKLKSISCAVALASILAFSDADAATFTVYGTGLDSTGGLLADGAEDLDYVDGAGDAGVAVNVGAIPPTWLSDGDQSSLGLSRWIWVDADASFVGTTTYTTMFDLTGLNASTAMLTLDVASDITVKFGLNGAVQGMLDTITAENFNQYNRFELTSGFVSGVNSLSFEVTNGGFEGGLRVAASGTAETDPVPDIPLPASLPLLIGALGFFAVSRRRKQA